MATTPVRLGVNLVKSGNPASVLQMHPVVKVCLDKAAAGDLKRAGYYRWVHNHKPAWQTY